MSVPVPLRLAVLAVALTGFYTLVGQFVPQKEVLPPQETIIPDTVTTEEMVEIGNQIFHGKGLCSTCHTIGRSGALRFPDMAGIGERAAHRVEGLSAVEYMAQSIYEPNDFIVPGFNPGMPPINKPPIALTDKEILTVIAYLQSLGGTPSVTTETKLGYPREAP